MTGPSGPSALRPRRLVRIKGLTAFRHRNYRLFFSGQAVSLVGTWMQQVAQAWLVLQITKDPLWLGIVAAAQFLPVMILGLFGGVLADVLPKRQTLMAVQVVMMLLAAVLAVLTATGLVEVWMILILAVGLGIANAVDMPVRQSFAIEMVGPKDVGNAVALNSAMFNGARVVGPAVAGLTIGAFGIAPAFAINALSFLAVLVGLSLMDDESLHRARLVARPRSVADVREQLVEGLRFVRHTPIVLLAVTTVGVVATTGMNFNVIVPPLASDILHSDAAGYGFLMTASGLGSLIAAVWLVAGGKPKPIRIALGALLLGVASILLSLTTQYWLALVLMVGIGGGSIAMAATANATIQLAVPDGLRGRVMSVYTTVFSASVPIGGLAAGALATSIGIPATIAVGGALSLLAGLGALAWYRRIRAAGGLAPVSQATPAVATPAIPTVAVPVRTPSAPSSVPAPQSGAPSTSAAFRPPNPNEVLSTRR